MTYTTRIPGGIITFVETNAVCPFCKKVHDEDFYMDQLRKSKDGGTRKKCDGCKRFFCITSNIRGDTVTYKPNNGINQREDRLNALG
jgi:sarcosine oxidase delta subunit